MKATAKDLRFQSRELLNTISRGEEVVITYSKNLQTQKVTCQQADLEGS